MGRLRVFTVGGARGRREDGRMDLCRVTIAHVNTCRIASSVSVNLRRQKGHLTVLVRSASASSRDNNGVGGGGGDGDWRAHITRGALWERNRGDGDGGLHRKAAAGDITVGTGEKVAVKVQRHATCSPQLGHCRRCAR